VEELESTVRQALEARHVEIIEYIQERDWLTLVGTILPVS